MVSQAAKDEDIKKWKYMVKRPLDTEFEQKHDDKICIEYRNECRRCEMHDLGLYAHNCCKEFYKWLVHTRNKNVRWAQYWAQKMLDRIKAVEVK